MNDALTLRFGGADAYTALSSISPSPIPPPIR